MSLFYSMLRTILTPDGIQFIDPSKFPFLDLFPSFTNPLVKVSLVEEDKPKNEVWLPFESVIPKPLFYSKPRFDYDVNEDPELRKRTTKYFYDELKDEWLVNDFRDLYKYLVVDNGTVRYIDSMENIDISTDNYEAKARFIIATIFERLDMEALLERYVKKHRVNWYDLRKKHKHNIREYVHRKIENHIRRRIYT